MLFPSVGQLGEIVENMVFRIFRVLTGASHNILIARRIKVDLLLGYTQVPSNLALIIFSFLLSTCDRNTYFQTIQYGMRTLCKTSCN